MSKKRRRIQYANVNLAVYSAIFIVVGVAMIVNVFMVSVRGYHMNSGTDIKAYSSISISRETIYARRGYIFDRYGNIIAEDSITYNLFAYLDTNRPGYGDIPAYVPPEEKENYAQILGEILEVEPEIILGYLEQDLYQTEFGDYGRNLSKATKDEIESKGLYGLGFTEQNARHYPLGKFASHLIGYARYNESDDVLVGETGVESIFNDYLMGKNGYARYNQDASGVQLIGTQSEYVAAKNGNNVYLTLDRSCQEGLDLLITQTQKQFNAEKVWGGVMEVETGKMLAWDCYPSYDPNTLDIENYLDLGSEWPYEPGSTMKTFAYAASIDSGNYDYNFTYNDHGYYNIGVDNNGQIYEAAQENDNGTVYNYQHKSYGTITLAQAYYRSLNVGIAHLVEDFLPGDTLEEYMDRFGFFQSVGTDAVNDLPGYKNMNYALDIISTGFGQASSITALQMFQAYSAIMNEGKMMRPYFVDRIENPYNHQVVYQGKPEVVGQPISPSTAQQVLDLMRGCVVDPEYGIAKWYALPNVEIVAKTGTGEVAGPNGYLKDFVTSSVVIGLPYNDPKIFFYMCIQTNFNNELNYKVDYTKQYLQKLIQYMGLSDNPTPEETPTDENVVINPASSYKNEMPELVNHSISYVDKVLETYNVKKIVLGNGNTVIKQYPEPQELITQNGKAFLLTSTDSFTMPDMTGWSRKDVTVFWQLTGISVEMNGYGYVTEQNIPAGEKIDLTSEILVTLSN